MRTTLKTYREILPRFFLLETRSIEILLPTAGAINSNPSIDGKVVRGGELVNYFTGLKGFDWKDDHQLARETASLLEDCDL